jgi:hypothetical protein
MSTSPESRITREALRGWIKAYGNRETRIFGFLRWRGAWNFKDITERMIAGFMAGLAAGLSFWLMERVFG